MEYKYSILDSDATSDLQLQHYLAEYDELCLISNARNGEEGLNTILKHSPDLVFIHLNDCSQEYFDMLVKLHQYLEQLPAFIGVSKTKGYAYEAIKNNFFDYWLLPFDEFNIRKTLLKLRKTTPQSEVSKTICLKSYRDYQYLDTNDILYLRADNNATEFVLKDGTIINSYKTLKTYQAQLPHNFIRVHQSYILNTDYVSRINYGKSMCTLKLRKLQLPFSKSYRENVDDLKKALSKNTISAVN